jgi:hypothetical protein
MPRRGWESSPTRDQVGDRGRAPRRGRPAPALASRAFWPGWGLEARAVALAPTHTRTREGPGCRTRGLRAPSPAVYPCGSAERQGILYPVLAAGWSTPGARARSGSRSQRGDPGGRSGATARNRRANRRPAPAAGRNPMAGGHPSRDGQAVEFDWRQASRSIFETSTKAAHVGRARGRRCARQVLDVKPQPPSLA